MTIPEIGHCAGSGAPPLAGTARDDASEPSGVCAACSGRFELKEDGTLSFHEPAALDAREDTTSD